MLRANLALALLLSGVCTAFAQETGSRACAACHRDIYDRYRATPMAASSGLAGSGGPRERFNAASFSHAPSGFSYRVSANAASYILEFEKPAAGLYGRKPLAYAIGSGATARSYLLADEGFLYEAPVAYYSASATWRLAPAYDQYAYPYLTRPIFPGCLNCHASFLQLIPGTQNRYATPPFREAGIACERCHGPGEAHIANMRAQRGAGNTAIVNPAKLAPDRRDGICSQCHLTGDVKVMRAGNDWRSFHPGDRLADSMTVFVRAGGNDGMKVTSHVENLAQSACKRASGDRLWCGTCHDPHSVPAAAERASWFRGKCLGCHDTAACSATPSARAKTRDDCIGCHMPKSAVTDAQHVVFTDHSIPRRPMATPAAPKPDAALVAFGGTPASPRDLALAYAIAAPRDPTGAYRARALELLEKVESQAPTDVEVLLYLAELYRNGGKPDLAIPLYRRATKLDSAQVTASVGLGGIMMERGQYVEAIRLWQDALSKNAGLELVRTNLAMAQWKSGDLAAAEASLVKAVALSPGFAPAAQLLQDLRRARGAH